MEDQNGHQAAILEVGNGGGQIKSEERSRKATVSKSPKVSTVSKTIPTTNVSQQSPLGVLRLIRLKFDSSGQRRQQEDQFFCAPL